MRKKIRKKLLEGKHKSQAKTAVDVTKQMIRTAFIENLHRKFLSKPVEYQRSPKKAMSPNEHKLRGPGGKYVNASERARFMEEGIISQPKLTVRKTKSDKEESDFECYNKSN